MSIKKLFVGFAVVALALGVAVVPAQAALPQIQVDAIITMLTSFGADANTLASVRAALMGTSAPAPVAPAPSMTVPVAPLTLESQGMQVTALQNFLISKGFAIPAGATAYFGAQTQSALAAYQTSKGISPATGYYGPITQAAVTADLTVVLPPPPVTPDPDPVTPGPGDLAGGEGYLDEDVVTDSDVSIDLGDSETVIEVDFEAKDSDIAVNRVDFMFDLRPWLYFDEVNLLVDGEEVGSLSSSSDFSEVGSEYRARFSGLNTIIRENDTATIALELVVLDSMAGTRDTDTVVVTLDTDGVRFTDGLGLVDYAPADAIEVEVDFDDVFGTGDMSVSIGDNSPEDEKIVLDETSRTNGVTVLEFDVEAEDGDVEVLEVAVEFDVTGNDTEDVLYRAYLYQGNTLLDQTSVTSDIATFDDVDYVIDEDDEVTFTVKVDFNRGDTLTLPATLTVVEVVVDGEDMDFEAVSEDLTVNEAHTILMEGLIAEFTSKSATTSSLGDDTIGKFTFKFDLTAYEDDFYINEDGTDFTVTLDNADTEIISTSIASTNATLTADDSYRISKGQTRTFTVEVEVKSSAATGPESVRATITELEYNTDSDLGGTAETLELGAPDYRSGSVTVLDAA